MTMRWKTTLALGAAAASAALMMAACGSGTDAGGGGSTATSGSGSTVSARDVPGIGTALTSPDGKTLYFSDQEADGTIRCKDACVSFWMPLTVSTGTTPTAGTGVTGKVATVSRPDGSVQVTYDGKPLYVFAEDGGPGDAKGNGFKDTFSGTDFVWHAATVSGAAPTAPASGGKTDNGYGY
jgi:predicted lipoprotein with Yx(FWY)xxD motif